MNSPSLFQQMTQAALELQGAGFKGFYRPIKKLAGFIHDPALEAINAELTDGVDFDSFMEESRKGRGSFYADGALKWPDDEVKQLGLFVKTMDKISESEQIARDFAHEFFNSGLNDYMTHIREMTRDLIIPRLNDYKEYVAAKTTTARSLGAPGSTKVFVVHGHDEGARESVARFIDKLGLEAVILAEQVDQGRTVIQKFEDNASEVGFAVVLMTPDDIGGSISDDEQSRRARQNVLFELGYFRGCLGKGKVCLVRKGDVEIPSDLAGVLYTEMDMGGGWKTKLAKEIDAAGLPIKSDWFRR